jgi:guanylate kinase
MNMKKIKIIALFGPAGAGKDALQEILVNELEWNGIISHTTRPIRDNEKDGVAYHFTTVYNFNHMIEQKKFLEYTKFNDWWYGTCIDSLSEDEINVGVFNIDGIKALLADSRVEVIPIYICVSDKKRLQRQLNREQNPNCLEICRRFLADNYDFKNKIDFEYNLVMNDGFIYDAAQSIINLTKNN